MGIFKISRAENRKIFNRPGIFVLTFLLVLILGASAAIFTPNIRQDTRPLIIKATVQEIFTEFDSGIGVESKSQYDTFFVDVAQTFVDTFTIPNQSIATLNAIYDNIYDIAENYDREIVNVAGDAVLDARKHELRDEIELFKTTYDNLITLSDYNLLTSVSNDQNIDDILVQALAAIPTDDAAEHTTIANNLNSLQFIYKINTYRQNIYNFELENTVVNSLNDYYYNTTLSRLSSIYDEIVAYNTTNALETDIVYRNEMNALIAKYKSTATRYSNICFNKVVENGLKDYTNVQSMSFVNFEDVDMYQVNEQLIKDLYLFESNTYEYNYANPYSVDSISNFEVNGFDFAFFTLELFTFIIIIYCVVLAASMIAGEESAGTMKLLAIRPYKRYKIVLGKLFAVFKIALLLLIVATAAAFVTGSTLYGVESMPVLSVFNNQAVFVMSPYVTMAIYLFTLYIEIIFYAVIALFISVIFRSNIIAVIAGVLTYFGSMVLNFVGSHFIFKYIPLVNGDLYKYFGNSYITSGGTSNLGSLFGSSPLPDADFTFALSLLAVTSFVLIVYAIYSFSRRDIK